jgi:HptB-dependent secretion and biofilm anti anti-sigma factor
LLEDLSCKEIVLDFSQVEYLDSSALGMMVLLQKKASGQNIKVKIKGARGATDDILKMANMQKLFEFI